MKFRKLFALCSLLVFPIFFAQAAISANNNFGLLFENQTDQDLHFAINSQSIPKQCLKWQSTEFTVAKHSSRKIPVDYSACGMYYMLTINFTLLANNPTPPADKGVTAFCSSDAGGCSFTALHLPARIDNQIINFKDDSKTGQFRLLFSQTQQ